MTNEPVDGAQLLADLTMFLQKYVRIGDDEYFVLAPWVLHCHTWLAWTRTPYLHVSSATQECGKTLLLELLEYIVPNPLLVMSVSAAVLARAIEQEHPVLMVDEVDQLKAGDPELWAAILQTVNSGYKKSGNRLVLVPTKGGWQLKRLSTYCAKILSGISGLPPATASRCIPIVMRRMMPGDRVSEVDEYVIEPEASALFDRCDRWGKANLKRLRDARPGAPAGLGHRQREVSRPLLAIADLISEEWGERVRGALMRLFIARAGGPDDNIKIQLLHDLEDVFGDRQKISSKDAVERLGADADSPWASWGRAQKPITQTQLAGLLKDFKVYPKSQRNDDGTNLKGYDRAHFAELWERYPRSQSDTPTTYLDFARNPDTTRVNIDENAFSDRHGETAVTPWKSAPDPHKQRVVPPVTAKTGGNGRGESFLCYVHHDRAVWGVQKDGRPVCLLCYPNFVERDAAK